MHLGEFVWLPPLILAISVVVGSANAETPSEIWRSVRRSFFVLGIGVVAVGAFVHIIASVFSG